MSTVADLPASAKQLNNAAGNGPMSYREDSSGREMEAVWVVPWEDQTSFRNAVVGTLQTFTSGGVTYTRRVPLQCPFDSGLYATALSGKYCGADGQITTSRPFSHVLFTVTFGLIPFGPGSDQPYQSLTATGALRQITVPTARYTFGNGEVLDHGVAVSHMGVGYLYTLYQVPNVAAAQSSLISLGSTPVNQASITIGGVSFPAGTILLETFSTETVQTVGGVTSSNLQVVLNYSSLPWNKLVRSDGTVDDVTPQLYTPGDLSVLAS